MDPGIYEQLVTTGLERRLRLVPAELVQRAALDPADAHETLAAHIADAARRALAAVTGSDGERLQRQVELTNRVLAALGDIDVDDRVASTRDLLHAIAAPAHLPGAPRFPARPEIPLSASALLVNGRDQPRIGTEVQKELASADRVDLLCAFIKWHGVRVIEEHLESLMRRGGQLRVITTTYIGASERRAIDRLADLGAQVRISYETRMTRLHAKAWLFHRTSGFSTAYVGSSNLSKSALLDGLEWNVRLSAVTQPHLLDTFRATFDEYWEDPAFEPYDPADTEQQARLDEALEAERGGPTDLPINLTAFDVRPWGYQSEILDQLAAEREIHGRPRSLVVMATGTGKTVVAGLDYRRLREAGTVDSLLFVAHRDEILSQSLATFRHILRDGSFGERFVGGARPREWRHVFASVQSLSRLDLPRELDPARFDMVVVDEFHHAEAPTYARLLEHLQPKFLVGLTATPERTDGEDVRRWFGGRIAVELRLWEALERGLLAPFQYFGLHDGTDLRGTRWKRHGYDVDQLENVYTGDDMRVRFILKALGEKVTDITRMRALGFCVSIRHAEFMAQKFTAAGIPSLAVTSISGPEVRKTALERLRRREVNALFTVDLFNEGVDVPEIDTVLFLRPTESATVFLQQLGRGLRLSDEKPCLTVLDFIGLQHERFRFDLRYRALNGVSRRALEREVEEGFPTLPAGCHIQLDRVASELVLSNVRSALRVDWKGLTSELRSLGDVTLTEFLEATGLELDDVYRRARGGWAGLRRMAGFDDRIVLPEDAQLAKAFGRMLHIDDPERLAFLASLTQGTPSGGSERAERLRWMAHFALWGANEPIERLQVLYERFLANESRCEELAQLVAVLRQRLRRITPVLNPSGRVPLHVHAQYSRDEALAAFGVDKPGTVRQGVKWADAEQADLFFVTLRKTEKHYSPATMYQDRAISPTLFQWESQHTTSEASPTGRRYVDHASMGTSVHLFVRESKEQDGDLGAPPYTYLGPAEYVRHRGDRPMRIIWRLRHEMPGEVFHAAKVAAG